MLATRAVEIDLLQRFPILLGMDEVGRGAIAGPVTVGGCVVDASTGPQPAGLADSKLVSAVRRPPLAAAVKQWAVGVEVASVPATAIDQIGIIRALRRAGMGVLAALAEKEIFPGAILLDGKHDWLSPPEDLQLWDTSAEQWPIRPIPVLTRVKADRDCAVVAGASIIAKVSRDAYMASLPDPGYGWASNKGYGSSGHCQALAKLGVSEFHRKSWKLPL